MKKILLIILSGLLIPFWHFAVAQESGKMQPGKSDPGIEADERKPVKPVAPVEKVAPVKSVKPVGKNEDEKDEAADKEKTARSKKEIDSEIEEKYKNILKLLRFRMERSPNDTLTKIQLERVMRLKDIENEKKPGRLDSELDLSVAELIEKLENKLEIDPDDSVTLRKLNLMREMQGFDPIISKKDGKVKQAQEQTLKEQIDALEADKEIIQSPDKIIRLATLLLVSYQETLDKNNLINALEFLKHVPEKNRSMNYHCISAAINFIFAENEKAQEHLLVAMGIAVPKLSISKMCFAQDIFGYGMYTPLTEPTFEAGDTARLYIEIKGFGLNQQDDVWSLRLEQGIRIRNSKGDDVFVKNDYGALRIDYRRPVFELYAHTPFTITRSMPADKYTVEIELRDIKTGEKAKQTAVFSVRTKR